MNPDLPFASGRAFRAKHTTVVSITGCGAAFLIATYLVTLMQMSTEGWHAFLWGLGITVAVLTPVGQFMQARADRAIAEAIDACAAGDATPEQFGAGFQALTKLPMRDVLWSVGNYCAAGLFLPAFMVWYLGDLSQFAGWVLAVGAMTGGLATAPFLYLAVKRMGEPLLEAWALSLSPEERAELGRGLPLRWKLALPMSLVGTVIVIFCGMLAFSLSQQPVEAHDTRSKAAFLEYVVEALEASEPAEGSSLAELRVLAKRHFVAEELLVIDRSSGEVVDGDATRLSKIERSYALAAGDVAGDSASLSSDNSFAWKVAQGGKVLIVAVTHGGAFAQAISGSFYVFAALLLFTVGFSLAVALLVARDVAGTTDRLRHQAERIATGDLRKLDVVESEDELGALARSFEVMLESLRGTVGRVALASQEVDASAANLAGAGQVVADSTNDQVRGLEQATLSMGSINQQVSGITDSAQVLNGNVEEASSSVLELGAASEELNQTASALNTQVEEVSSSIEQMVRSVSQIAENNEGLAVAVEETSTSMSEMAAAMREVESNAHETSRLSGHVVELADGGRERVQQTIAGMAQIRDATETAEGVIQGLAGRMKEIGAIVDVIDDVADETNLLALNAAIIAAQAGDQGRSFSVVADEIKDLADRVLSSTKEIGGLIDSVQAESERATTAIQDGAERVQHGVDLSAEAGLSLEQITSAARDSGGRIEQIVHSVQEQSRATSHVAGLMERVSSRVEEIRGAGQEQAHGTEVVMRGAVVMRDVAQQTHRTTEEQSRGAIRIRDSIESVRDAVDRIHASLQEQSEACRSAVSFLEQVHERTRVNDAAADQMRQATGELKEQALALRSNMQRFRVE